MTDYAEQLESTFPLRRAALMEMIARLRLPTAGTGIDVGCGLGLLTRLIAQILGPDSSIIGVDISPEFIVSALKAAQEPSLRFQVGDARNLDFESAALDWALSVDCVGYTPMDSVPLIKEMARIVKPGGLIAIAVWSSQMLLPGFPRLEAGLNATDRGLAPFVPDSPSGNHPLRLLGRLRLAGLEDLQTFTVAGGVNAPLNAEHKRGLMDLIEMRWDADSPGLEPDDRDLLKRLTDPDSQDFILDNSDYYCFFTYSVFTGLAYSK